MEKMPGFFSWVPAAAVVFGSAAAVRLLKKPIAAFFKRVSESLVSVSKKSSGNKLEGRRETNKGSSRGG